MKNVHFYIILNQGIIDVPMEIVVHQIIIKLYRISINVLIIVKTMILIIMNMKISAIPLVQELHIIHLIICFYAKIILKDII